MQFIYLGWFTWHFSLCDFSKSHVQNTNWVHTGFAGKLLEAYCRSQDQELWTQDDSGLQGSRTEDPGQRTQDGSGLQDRGPRTEDRGYRTEDQGVRIRVKTDHCGSQCSLPWGFFSGYSSFPHSWNIKWIISNSKLTKLVTYSCGPTELKVAFVIPITSN